MNVTLYDKINIAKVVNVEVVNLQDAPKGYTEFDSSVQKVRN